MKHIHPLLLALLLLTACQAAVDLDGLESVDYEATYALPLVNSSTSIQQLLEDFEDDITTIQVNPGGLLRLYYRGDILEGSSKEIFESIAQGIPPILPVPNNNAALPLEIPGDISIDQLDLKTGALAFFMENGADEALTVTFTVEQMIKDGTPLSFTATIPAYSGDGPKPSASNADTPIDLSGYSVIPKNDSLYVSYTATSSSGAAVDPERFLLQLNQLTFDYAQGYLGQQVYAGGRDTIEIDFFESGYIDGSIYFAEPEVRFLIENSFGIPTRSLVRQFEVLTVNGDVLPIRSPIIEQGIDFPYPLLSEIGQVKSSAIAFTKDNSNIDSLLGSAPIAVDYEVDALSNPDGDTELRGFVTDSSYYKVQVEVDLPLIVRVQDFEVQDTIALDLEETGNVQHAEFKLITDNEIPLDARLQAWFLDETGQVLDSLFSVPAAAIGAAPVDGQGEATGVTTQTTFIDYPAERFNRIRNSKELRLEVTFSSGSNEAVNIRNEQELDVRLGVIVGVKSE